ncbi:MAG: PAS domain S-box protein [Chthoniobacterales bacterium]|nr:PAS domain S-box protein [Chthoniobacterales bacterium]
MKTPAEGAPGAVLIATPTGRDAALAAATLAEAGIENRVCESLRVLAEQLGDETGAVLLAEEALTAAHAQELLAALRHQPAWSDLPLLVLTSGVAAEQASSRILHFFGATANVVLIERPLGSLTLVSAVQTALRARQRQYEVRDLLEQRETLLSSISDAFSALDHEWKYTYVNARVAQLAGVPRSQLIGRNIWQLFPEAVGTEFYHRCHQAMAHKQPDQFEGFHEPWNRWMETRIYPTAEGIAVLRADITERKRQEEHAREVAARLEESEDRLRLATEAAAIGTFDFDPVADTLQLSARARELLGLAPDVPVTYESYLAAFHPADRHIAPETVRQVLQPGRSDHYDIEYRTVAPDARERWLAERGRVVLDEEGKATRFIGTFLDITERKNAELALQQAKHQAEAANRAKDQFLAMLSHELRTPLTPVLMTIASLRRQPDLKEELRRDLEVLQRNVELEALLIDDLLDLTRIAHGKLELHSDAVDIHASLEHALNISSVDLHKKRLTVARRFEAVEHHCWADAARLQQVFWNLVKNAVKFTPPEGRIELRTRNDEAHHIIIEISDTGIGIDPALMPRIFDAFEQGGRTMTSQYGGLGLGLAISKRVIDMHGGTIVAQSEGAGRGATFTIMLQAMATSLLDGPVVSIEQPMTPGVVEILLVEDHDDTARVLRRILEHAGYVVTHADCVTRAREIAATRKFDLMISDLGLPDGSGLDLMRSLQATCGLSGIALSGFGTDDDLAASAAAGFAEHLTKPVDWPQLRGAIERLLRAKAAGELPRAASS